MCRRRLRHVKVSRVQRDTDYEDSEGEELLTISMCTSVNSIQDDGWDVHLGIKDQQVRCRIDTAICQRLIHPRASILAIQANGRIAWKQRFERYRIASKLHEDDEDIQVNSLIYAMGKEAAHIFKSRVFDEGDEGKYEKVMEKYNEYFVPKKNVIHERARFRERKQASGESSEAFIRALYELAEHCDFPDKNDQIRDQIVIGLRDKDVSEKLQLRSTLTLEQAIQYARQTELVKTQIQDQTTQFKSLDEVKRYGKQKQSSPLKHFSANQTHNRKKPIPTV